MTEKVPDKMLACVLHGKEDARLEEIPVPTLQAGDLLLKAPAIWRPRSMP